MIPTIKRAVRAVLEANGYWVRHRSVLPYGIDYQMDIRRLASDMAIPIRTFFDVGAHTGETSLAVLRNFSEAQIFAFEPHPATFSVLEQNVSSPRFKGVNVALSDRDGKAEFYEYGHLATCNTLVPDNQYAVLSKNPFKVFDVTCRTLDAFCNENDIGHVDVLKIDTEGHELAVLLGSKQTLAVRSVSFIYVEFSSMLPKPGTSGGALLPISSMLEPLGFRFVASYPECTIRTGELLITSNALFVRPAMADSPSVVIS